VGLREDWGPTGNQRLGTSSSQFQEGMLKYPPFWGGDGNPKTAWCAKKGDASAWIQINSSCSGDILGLMFRNGIAESPTMFSQRDRIHHAYIQLFVDGVDRWEGEIALKDTMKPQHLDIPDVPCKTQYTAKLSIRSRHLDIGPVCISEFQAMIDSKIQIPIVQGPTIESREVPAKVNLLVYAGPSTDYTLLGYAPILLTRYGAPYLRIVEERGDFVRFDRLRRRFEPKEKPPKLQDPTYGGWVHRDLLDWEGAFP